MIERRIAEGTHPLADGLEKVWVVATQIETTVAIFVVKRLGEHC